VSKTDTAAVVLSRRKMLKMPSTLNIIGGSVVCSKSLGQAENGGYVKAGELVTISAPSVLCLGPAEHLLVFQKPNEVAGDRRGDAGLNEGHAESRRADERQELNPGLFAPKGAPWLWLGDFNFRHVKDPSRGLHH
jgi:hypothetical protein